MRTLSDAALDLAVQIEEFVNRPESYERKARTLIAALSPSTLNELRAWLEPEE